MTTQTIDRLHAIEAQLEALTQLTLSHIAASDLFASGLAAATIDHVKDQRNAAAKQHRQRTVMYLNGYIDALKGVIGLFAND